METFAPDRFDELENLLAARFWFRSRVHRASPGALQDAWEEHVHVVPPTMRLMLKASPQIIGLDEHGAFTQGALDTTVFCELREMWSAVTPTTEPYISAEHRSGFWLSSASYHLQVGPRSQRFDLDAEPFDGHPYPSHFHGWYIDRAATAPVVQCPPITAFDFIDSLEQRVAEERFRQGCAR